MSQEGIVELGKIYKSVSINEFHVKREDNAYLVSFTFTHEDGEVSVKLSGVRDSSSIIELLEAERIWAEKSDGSQLEFGGLTLGISHEYFTEVTFDAFAS